MSAAIPSSPSSQPVPPASPPPEISRDPDPDPTPTPISPSEAVADTKPDEPTTSLPPSPRAQSLAEPAGLVDRHATVESHTPSPAPALLPVPAGPHAALSTSPIEVERPLPAIPVGITLQPRMAASMRPPAVSENGNSQRPFHGPEPPPVQPLELPGSGIFRQRPPIHPAEFGSPGGLPPARVADPSQSTVYPLGSVGARLCPTLEEAVKARNSAWLQAKWTTYSINIAIGLQVLLGALTTALGASLNGESIQVSVSVLGSLSTLVASFLARTRGTSEPESSLLREQALSHFIRRLRAFILDQGMRGGYDQAVENFRTEFERLLNASNPNAGKAPLFDPELNIHDEGVGMVGLTEEDLAALRRRRPRAATMTVVQAQPTQSKER